MLCDKCKKNEASVHLQHISNGVKEKLSLCASCSNEMVNFANQKLENQINDLLDSPSCECGSTLSSIVESRKLGCPKCYETFGEQLEDVLWRTHGAAKHVGRLPHVSVEQQEKRIKVASLKAEMETAISTENYERAAEIRDELKELQGAVAE